MPEEEKKPETAAQENPETKQEKKKENKLGWKKNIVLTLHDIVLYLSLISVVFLLLFRIVIVSGTSMNLTLLDGDYLLLLSNIFYREPEQGDIVVVSKDSFDEGAPIVKRVIATEGQTVDIDFAAGIVYVDGVALEEDYTWTPTNSTGTMTFPLTVEEGCIFVMGDNRNNSRDSRFIEIGQIDKREVLGKAIFLFVPGTNGTDAEGNPKIPRDFSRIGVIS